MNLAGVGLSARNCLLTGLTAVEALQGNRFPGTEDTVRFVGELITAVRDSENRIVEGDPNEVRRQSDIWTFSREMGSVDPNWLLTGTGT